MSNIVNSWKLVTALCMTLGLAPFLPEPHIWGKLLWVAGGARGMEPMDWFDLLLHGLPWLLLIRISFLALLRRSDRN